MKKFLAQITLAVPVWFVLGGYASAMCIWFAPPSRQFEPATNMKTLVSRVGEEVTFTVQPQFSGNATDFALVMPFPSEPTVSEAPEQIFTQLEDLTNPELQFDDVITLEALNGDASVPDRGGVTVIEERDVGDFSTVTLSATNESALTTWLENEGYEITEDKRQVIASYVASDGYFVALKVNMAEADVDASGFVTGELRPISFTYSAEDTMLPLRLMAGEGSLLTLTVYALGEEYSYIPGAEIQFAKKIDADDLKEHASLEAYDAWKKWLVRNVIQIEPAEIKNDVALATTIDPSVVVPGETPLVLNPEQLEPGTGIVVSDNATIVYTDETPETPEPETPEATSGFTTAMVVLLAISNVVLLIIVIAQKNTPATRK